MNTPQPFAAGLEHGESLGDHHNISRLERWISGVAGTALVTYGLKKRSIPGLGMALFGGMLLRRGATGHCDLYQALGIDTAGSTAGAPSDYFRHGIHVEKAVTINRPAEELYRFWRQLENLPRVMGHLERVEVIDNTRSHWVAKAPAGFEVEWDAEIINDEPGALIAWKAVEGSQVPNAGSVRFLPAPPGRGTEVKVTLEYLPPAGRLGAAIAKLFGEEPSQQVRDDLARFKQLMESGEIASVEGQPAGRGAFETRGRGPRSPATVVGAAGADHGKNTPAPTVPGAAGSGLPGQTFGAGTQGPGSRPGPADGD